MTRRIAPAGAVAIALLLLASLGALLAAQSAAPDLAWRQWGGPHRNFAVDVPLGAPPHFRVAGERATTALEPAARPWALGDPLRRRPALHALPRRGRQGEDRPMDRRGSRARARRWHRRDALGASLPVGGAGLQPRRRTALDAAPRGRPPVRDRHQPGAPRARQAHRQRAVVGRLRARPGRASGRGATHHQVGVRIEPDLRGRDLVVCFVGGPGQSVVAFARATARSPGRADTSWFRERRRCGSRSTVRSSSCSSPVARRGSRAATGEVLWAHAHDAGNDFNFSLPLYGEDQILFLSSAYRTGSRALQLRREGARHARRRAVVRQPHEVPIPQRRAASAAPSTARPASRAPRSSPRST